MEAELVYQIIIAAMGLAGGGYAIKAHLEKRVLQDSELRRKDDKEINELNTRMAVVENNVEALTESQTSLNNRLDEFLKQIMALLKKSV